MFSNKRPKPGESEEEILAQQNAFLKALQQGQRGQSFQPAAQVVKVKKTKREDGAGDQIDQNEELMDVEGGDETDEDEIKPGSLSDPILITPLLSSTIKEREFDLTKLQAFSNQMLFPKIKLKSMEKLSTSKSATASGGNKKGKSLFARSFDSSFGPRGSKTAKVIEDEQCSKVKGKAVTIGDQLHPYLSGMTQQEILEEQQKLMEKLDPKLIEFIRSRKSKNPYEEPEAEGPNVNDPDPEVDPKDLPIDPKSVQHYPGMKEVEMEKLAWTGLIKEERPEVKSQDSGGADARFGFDGKLILSSESDNAGTADPKSFEKGLHHHGEEMNRAGYTFEELLTLARSTKGNQRSIALETIGNIYENAHTGMYDFYFDKGLFQLANYMDFIYAIRKALDEEDKTSVNSALKCLGQILYPWEEEICLDIVYLWDGAKPHPWLGTKTHNLASSEVGEEYPEKQMKDNEMLDLDLIEFLVHRSALLTRISYFLEMDENILTETGVQGILKILIRVARHSPNAVIGEKNLLKCLIKNYASADWSAAKTVPLPPTLKGIPLPMALKIIRILIDSSQQNASVIYSELKIVPTILSYLAYDEWHLDSRLHRVESLILESFRIWIAFIGHGFAIDEYSGFFPVLIKFVTSYVVSNNLHPFDMLHSAHLFSLLLSIVRMTENSKGIEKKSRHSHWSLVKDFVSSIEQFVCKVSAFLSSQDLQDSSKCFDPDAAIFSLSIALRFLLETGIYRNNKLSPGVITAARNLVKSTAYENITNDLRKYSLILAETEEGNRYPSNLASVKAIRFGGKWNPIVEFRSAMPFLTSLFAFLQFGGSDDNFDKELAMNSSLKAYVSEILKSATQKSNEADFFVRFELSFLCELVKFLPANSQQRFSVSYKALSEVPKCSPKLFNRLFKVALECSCVESDREDTFDIFGGYLMEVEDAQAGDDDEQDKSDENKKEEIESTNKKKVSFGEGTKPGESQSMMSNRMDFQLWSERCIGSHWILEPLKRMHTIVTSVPTYLKSHMDEIEMQVRICLQLVEKCLECYCDFIIQTPKDLLAVYCRICSVFMLGDPGIYIDKSIAPILKNILCSLVNSEVIRTHKDKPVFTKSQKLPGIPNLFSDFYRDLLKEYTNNSYFNEVFAQFLMIPLRIPEKQEIKCNFWTLDCINSIRISEEQSLIPEAYLTSGVEKDSQILGIYMRLIHSKRISKEMNPFLFQFLKSHLNNSYADMDELLKKRMADLKL